MTMAAGDRQAVESQARTAPNGASPTAATGIASYCSPTRDGSAPRERGATPTMDGGAAARPGEAGASSWGALLLVPTGPYDTAHAGAAFLGRFVFGSRCPTGRADAGRTLEHGAVLRTAGVNRHSVLVRGKRTACPCGRVGVGATRSRTQRSGPLGDARRSLGARAPSSPSGKTAWPRWSPESPYRSVGELS